MKTNSPFSRLPYRLFWLLVLLTAAGCQGYRSAPEYNQLPGNIRSVAIPLFKNETFESNIEAPVTNAVMNEFIKNQQFSVTPDNGDATLVGIIQEFRLSSIAYSSDDRARQYRAFLTVEVTLRNTQTGEILWRNPRMIHDEEYSVEPVISFTDTHKQEAVKRIAAELAERMYEEIVQGY